MIRPAHHLYAFSLPNGEREFIIISNEPREQVIAMYAADGWEFSASVEIISDATAMPCDRALRAG